MNYFCVTYTVLYFVLTLQVKQYRDFISLLPEPLAIRILSYLVPKELLIVCQVKIVHVFNASWNFPDVFCEKKIVAWVTIDLFQVSKTWRRLASRDELWQAKCQETYVGEFWIKCQFVLFCFVSKLVMNNLPRDKKCSLPHFRTFKEIGYKLSTQRYMWSFELTIVTYIWLTVALNTIDQS